MMRGFVRTAICFGALLLITGCGSNRSASSEAAKNTPTPIPTNKPTPNSEEAGPRWVTVSLETGIFGPDGKQRRWVKLQPGRPVRLRPGEWVTIHGTKYTGRTGGRSEIWLESGEVKARNVETTKEEK